MRCLLLIIYYFNIVKSLIFSVTNISNEDSYRHSNKLKNMLYLQQTVTIFCRALKVCRERICVVSGSSFAARCPSSQPLLLLPLTISCRKIYQIAKLVLVTNPAFFTFS